MLYSRSAGEGEECQELSRWGGNGPVIPRPDLDLIHILDLIPHTPDPRVMRITLHAFSGQRIQKRILGLQEVGPFQ